MSAEFAIDWGKYPNFSTYCNRIKSGKTYRDEVLEYLRFSSNKMFDEKQISTAEAYASYLHDVEKLKTSTIWTKLSIMGTFFK